MASIRIRVGAALDAGSLSVFQPLEKAAEKARTNIDRSLNKAAKSQEQIPRAVKTAGDKAVAEAERMADKMLRDEQKANDKLAREVKKAANEKVRLEKAANKEIERDLARHRREKERAARDEAKAAKEYARQNPSVFSKAWWNKPRGQIGIGRRAAIGVSRGAALAYGIGGAVISEGIGLARETAEAFGVETRVGAHIGHAVQLQSQTQDIVNAGYIPGAKGAQGQLQDTRDVMADIVRVGNATATSFEDIGAGLRSFVGLTGDLETGRNVLSSMAHLAKATGADFVEMATAAAEVSNHLEDMPDKGEAINAVMRVIAGQGKLGAVEIKDLARQMAKIAATAPRFEGGVTKTIGELGLLAQEAKLRGGSTSASQAATAVARFSQDFAKGQTIKHWRAAGLNPYTDNTMSTLRRPEEIILEALKFSKGNIPKLAQLFPNAIGMRAVQGFASIYSETKGDEGAKIRAVAAEFDRLRAAQLSQEEVTRAFNAAMETSKSAVQLANNRLDELGLQLHDRLLPAVAALAPAISAMIPLVVGFVDKFAGLLGIDIKGDEEARKTASSTKTLDAAEKILAEGGQAPSNTVGVLAPGGTPVAGAIDPTQKAQLSQKLEKMADEQAGALAEEEGKFRAHPENYSPTTTVGEEGGAVTEIANEEGLRNLRHLEEMRNLHARTLQVMQDIRRAVEKAPAPGGPAPVSNSGSGVEDPNSEP